jgi:hypothetical protein
MVGPRVKGVIALIKLGRKASASLFSHLNKVTLIL